LPYFPPDIFANRSKTLSSVNLKSISAFFEIILPKIHQNKENQFKMDLYGLSLIIQLKIIGIPILCLRLAVFVIINSGAE
jgi:hypothetical protein